MYYWISIGSNIDPVNSIGRTLEEIGEVTPVLWLYPPLYTEPVGIATNARFINGVLTLYSSLELPGLKQRFETIEVRLGRDRADPDSSRKDRICDIDILSSAPSFDPGMASRITEPYLRPVIEGRGQVAPIVAYESPLPDRPATIYLDRAAREIRILDDEPQALIDWVEATF